MALSFVQDKAPVDLLKMPFEDLRQPLRDRFHSIEMSNSPATSQMKVFLRVRPFTKQEIEKEEDQKCFSIEDSRTIIARAPVESFTFKNSIHGMGKVNHKYTFTSILGPESRQVDVFNEVVLDPVKEFIDGRNSLVFTYGITSSGKTYTIQGPSNAIGILPRALDIIFNSVGERLHENSGLAMLAPENFADVVKLNSKDYESICKQKEELLGSCYSEDQAVFKGGSGTTASETESVVSQDSSDSLTSARLAQILSEANEREKDGKRVSCDLKDDINFSIWVSYAEIYNEYIYDLLTPLDLSKRLPGAPGALKSKGIRRPALELRTDKRGSIYIRGLRCFPVSSADDAYRVLVIGRRNQQMASTRLNLTSSRSHTVFSVYAIRCAGKGQPNFARISTLTFCDLAGSERTLKTQNIGERLREAGNINTSLLTLGRCIKILRNNQENPDRPQLVPYRESKLTRLFQSFFTGKGKLCMLVNINQCASVFDETMHVLKFSALAKQIVVQQEVQPVTLVHQEKKNAEDEARRTRFRSLGLRTPKPGKRVSIAWENTPLSCGKKTNISFAPPTLLFTGGDGTLVEEPLEETLTSMTEETGIEYDTEELLSIIEDLKKQLIQAKQDVSRVETRVREEVCQEMDELVLRLESQHEEALREQEICLLEQSERRIQLYMNSVNKTNKRLRISPSAGFGEEGCEDGNHNKFISENLTLKSKLEELEAELSDLRSQCSDQKEALVHITRERDEFALAVTSLQFKTSIAEREAAQKLARSEDAVRELGEQLEKLTAVPKDSSQISDFDCQFDQSRLQLLEKDNSTDSRDAKTQKPAIGFAVSAQQIRKKVFSPVLPKRPSDDAVKTPSPASVPVVKTTVFSPVLGTRVSDSSSRADVNDRRHYEDSSVSFTIPPTPATIVKKDASSLAKENETLLSELKVMQIQLNKAVEARKHAEENVSDLRQELANATSTVGSFLRHEIETEQEEIIEKLRKESDVLKSELKLKESSVRDLEMRCVSKHDALVEAQELRDRLTSRCEQLETECRRRMQEVKEERQRRMDVTKTASEVEQSRLQCEELAYELRKAVTLAEAKAHDCESLEKKQTRTLAEIDLLKKSVTELTDSLSEERSKHALELERVVFSAEKEGSALKSKLKAAEEKTEEFEKLKYILETSASENNALKATVVQLQNQATALEDSQHQKLKNATSRMEEIEAELQRKSSQCRAAETSLNEVRDELQVLRKETAEHRQKLVKAAELSASKREALEKQLNNYIEREQSQKVTMEKKEGKIKNLKDHIASLEMEIEQREREYSSINQRNYDLEKQLNSLKESHVSEGKENLEPSSGPMDSRKKESMSHARDRSISRDRPKTFSSSETKFVDPPTTRRVTRSMRHK